MEANLNGFNTLELFIASEVRAEMGRANVKQSDVATAIGMHPNVFARKYHGRVGFTSSELVAIAQYLGTSGARLTAEAERRYFEKKKAVSA